MWPDNWTSVSLFVAMRNQWRAGMNGFYGLDMNVLPEFWRRFKVPQDQRDEVFGDLLVMEAEALSMMARHRNR